MSDIGDEELLDLPPSAKLVFLVLHHKEPLTQKQIADESRLSERTVRYALRQLEKIDAVNEQIHFRDARQMLYTLTSTHHIEDPVADRNPCRS